MMGCCECNKWVYWVILVVGVLFLLRDLNIWPFWNIQWWTVVFILAGLAVFYGKHTCGMSTAKTGMKK